MAQIAQYIFDKIKKKNIDLININPKLLINTQPIIFDIAHYSCYQHMPTMVWSTVPAPTPGLNSLTQMTKVCWCCYFDHM